MKTSSWEIIVAGFIFVGVSIFLIENNSENLSPPQAPAPPDSIQLNFDGERLKLIELKNLENFENLESLKNLRNLKNLTNFLPAEIRAEVEAEIDEAMKEFEQESVDVVLDSEKGTISINRAMSVSSGGWAAVSPGIFAYVKEFDSKELKEAQLRLPFGSIDIVGSSDPQAKLTIQASGQVSTKEDLTSKLNTVADINPETAHFEISTRGDRKSEHNIQLQATLQIPHQVEVNSTTNAGHISSKDIDGSQFYKTSGGHITLINLSGEIRAETGGGHIAITDSEGGFRLSSKGGNIRAENSTGSLIMKTFGGNIQAYDFSGSFEATTKGGNIELRLLDIAGNSNASTGAGSITIWFPKNGNAAFDLSGSSVEIGPDLNFQGSRSSGAASGNIGNGGNSLTAKTNYGSIILKSID